MIDLTPLEVRKKKSDFRRVMRGYDPGLVDDFLDLVADRLDELVRENAALSERANQQDQQVAEFRDREKALTDALVTAQEMREEMRRQTTLEAELAKRSAEQEAAQLRASSTQEVALLRSTAEQEVARLRATAAEEVAQLRAKVQAEVTQLRGTAQQEAQELRSTARQERERDEAALRQVRAQQQQFLAQYHSFLERELSELRLSAQSMGVAVGAAVAVAAGRWADAVNPSEHAAAVADPIEVPEHAAKAAEPVDGADVAEADEPFMVKLGSLEAVASLEAVDSLEPPGSDMPLEPPLEASHDDAVRDDPAALEPELLDEEAMLLAPPQASGSGAAAAGGFMFPDDPIEDDELSFVDALEPFEPLESFEPFEPEPFEPEPFEPEPFEPESFEPESAEPAASESASNEAETRNAAATPGPAAGEIAADGRAVDEELVLYDALSAEPGEDGVPGAVGLGSVLDEPPGWVTAPAWTIQGVDLLQDSTLSAELPEPPAPMMYDEIGNDEADEDDEEASEILRNAAAAGYRVPELDDMEELLLDDAVFESGEANDEDDGEDAEGWLPTLLDDK
jgi:cell division initiation protein